MEQNDIQFSVIIVNFQSERNLGGCIASFYNREDFRQTEIIIVNNDEKEDLERIKNDFPKVKIIKAEKNLGFGRANNLGVGASRGKFLFFLNPDARLYEGRLDDIYGEFMKNKDLGIIGSRIIDKKGKLQPWISGKKPNLIELAFNNLGIIRNKKVWESPERKDTHWVAATAFFVRRDVFQALRGFDEKIFMYFEDIDLCARVGDLGKRVFYFPKFTAMHLGGGSYESKKVQKKHYYDSQEYYFKKHRGKIEYYIIKLLRIILGK